MLQRCGWGQKSIVNHVLVNSCPILVEKCLWQQVLISLLQIFYIIPPSNATFPLPRCPVHNTWSLAHSQAPLQQRPLTHRRRLSRPLFCVASRHASSQAHLTKTNPSEGVACPLFTYCLVNGDQQNTAMIVWCQRAAPALLCPRLNALESH